MWIELVDLLRCPREHEDSWLVLSATRIVGRHVVEGTLGCHICGREYQLLDGVADLRDAEGDPDALPTTDAGEPTIAPHAAPAGGEYAPAAELATMLAAYANLADAGGCAAIGGSPQLSTAAEVIGELTGVAVLLVNPTEPLPQGLSGIRCGHTLPISSNGLRALVLDAATAAGLDLATACRRVRPGGRIVLPAGTRLPPGARELAHDSEWLVAERTPPRVELRRA